VGGVLRWFSMSDIHDRYHTHIYLVARNMGAP
jgi:predicted SpoU family rRNA methylase